MKRTEILNVMLKKYNADYESQHMNLSILLDNPRSIPEHSNFTDELDGIISKMVELSDKTLLVGRLLLSIDKEV